MFLRLKQCSYKFILSNKRNNVNVKIMKKQILLEKMANLITSDPIRNLQMVHMRKL